MPLIDVHNHILSREYTDLLARHGGHRYSLAQDAEGRTVVMRGRARFMTFTEPMFDPELRFPAMDEVGVAIELLSYTCPNAFWREGGLGENRVEQLPHLMLRGRHRNHLPDGVGGGVCGPP